MIKQFLLGFIAIAAVHASGDFVVLHTPNSVNFEGHGTIDQSLLKEVYAATLGFTVRQRGLWDGLSIVDPFSLPEAVVNVAIEGVDTLDIPEGQKYPLNVDEVEESTWQALSGCLAKRDNDKSFVRIYLSDGLDALGQSALGELKPTPIDQSSLKALSMATEEDKKFLEEVQLLFAIAKKVPAANKAKPNPGVYWLVVSGLRPVYNLHGKNSTAAKEAHTLLNKALNAITEAFVDAYNGMVLVTAFTNNASHLRHTRSVILERETRDIPASINLAKKYTENYPVIFNIILWFGVIFFFSLLAICLAIAEMDPGRDSIIYRMTSNRMKKDN